jgi:hypothetical protein
VLATSKPTRVLLADWEGSGVTESIWGLPDRSPDEVVGFIGRQAARLGLGRGTIMNQTEQSAIRRPSTASLRR